MRIYADAVEMVKEVERDLFEMGIDVHPETMQDRVVANDPDYATKELFGYGYVLTSLDEAHLKDMIDHLGGQYGWCLADFLERTAPARVNPGEAYKIRGDTWGQFLRDGEFSYTYNERIREQLPNAISELRKRPNSRQVVITMYDRHQDMGNWGGKDRVPCSLHYQFAVREGKLHCTYVMRSCDFLEHFPYDVYMAARLTRHVAEKTGHEPGHLIHFVGSLHAYAKDLKKRGVF